MDCPHCSNGKLRVITDYGHEPLPVFCETCFRVFTRNGTGALAYSNALTDAYSGFDQEDLKDDYPLLKGILG